MNIVAPQEAAVVENDVEELWRCSNCETADFKIKRKGPMVRRHCAMRAACNGGMEVKTRLMGACRD